MINTRPPDGILREIHIATNCLKRLVKEARCYEKIYIAELQKRDAYAKSGGDESVVKQLDGALIETEAVKPVVHGNVKSAYIRVFNALTNLEKSDNCDSEQTEYKEAAGFVISDTEELLRESGLTETEISNLRSEYKHEADTSEGDEY